MPHYVLFLHGPPSDWSSLSPEEIRRVTEKYHAWTMGLVEAGRLLHGAKLRDEGGRRLVRRGGETAVTDGPFTEAREVVGGLFGVEAESYDEAVELARGCPALERGARIEVREVEPT